MTIHTLKHYRASYMGSGLALMKYEKKKSLIKKLCGKKKQNCLSNTITQSDCLA